MTNGLEKVEAKRTALVAGGSMPFPEASELVAFRDAAAWVARSGMFPQFRNPEQAFVGMLTVRDLGLSLVQGLALVYPVEGKMFIEVKGRVASLMAKCPTFEWNAVRWDEHECYIKARLRPTDEWKDMGFTIEQAKTAGLVKDRGAWQKYPKDMLLWRALARWINTYAPHLLYAMPTHMLEMEDEPVAGDAAPEAAFDAKAGVEHDAAPVTDYRKLFADRARAMGKRKQGDFLELLRLVFKELGLTPPATYTGVTSDEWEKGYRFLDSRYDENGKPRPREVEAEVVEPESVATPEAPEPEPMPQVEIPMLEPEADPVPAPKGPDWAWLTGGKVEGLLELCNMAQKAFRARGRNDVRFLSETSGSGIWFVEPDTLSACGCSKNGKPVPVLLVMEDGADPRYEKHKTTDGLRVMIARSVKAMLDSLEVAR